MPGDSGVTTFSLRLPTFLIKQLDEEVQRRRTFIDPSYNRSRLIREILLQFLRKDEAAS